MKTEFLQNFKVGDQPLPKEAIDAILAENGRDIEAAKKPFADYDAIKDQLKTARDGLKAFEGVNVASLQGEIAKLQGQLKDKDTEWQKKLDDMAFDGILKDAITAAKGKNVRAITALLDVESLRSSKDQSKAIEAALEGIKQENDYLFDAPTPPPYAPGAGTQHISGKYSAAEMAIRAAAGLKND